MPERIPEETRFMFRAPNRSRAPRYDDITEIDRGGAGVVYRARDRESGDLVAIKVLDWQGDSRVAARFQQEVKALGRIRHLNVVRLRGSGWQDQQPYLVMDWIDGQNLESLIFEARRRGELLQIPRIIDCLVKVASAVVEVHNQRLIHRDIKPANIMIENGTERPVLVDFGIVKRGAELGLTRSQELLGTPNTMSPEQIDPGGDYGVVSPKTDIWGLGVTLYKALTGQAPFEAPSLMEIYSRVLTRNPTPIHSLRPETPAWLEELCLRCLEKSPDRRPSLADFIAAMLSGDRSVPAAPVAPAAAERRPPTRRRRSASRAQTTRRPSLGLTVGGAIIVAALALAFWIVAAPAKPVPWTLLEDLERWTQASGKDQRAIAEAVAARLGEAYAFVELRGYKGPPAHQIARFRHVKTGAILHLIPGGAMVMGRELSSADRARLAEVAAELREAEAEQRRLQALIADPQLWLDQEMGRITFETNQSGMRMAMGDRSVILREMSLLTEDSYAEWRHVKDNLSLPQSTSRSDIIDLLVERRYLLIGLRDEYLKRKLAWHREEVKRRPDSWREELEKQDATIERLRWISTVPARSPAHTVRLEDPFLIGETELSWRAWTAIPGQRGRQPGDGASYPARDLSWDEAAAWLKAAGDGLRLPSESEWEYACRGSSTSRYYWGEKVSDAHCRFQRNSRGRPWGVKLKNKHLNAFGLADMLGNVAEWCADDWLADYQGKSASAAPRRSGAGAFEEQTSAGKVVRGGGYDSPKIMCRSRARWSMKRTDSAPSVGLRIARSFKIPRDD